MFCRAEATAAAQQLQAAQAEAGDLSVSRSQLQHELAAVEAQRKHSQAELAQAEHRVQQLQVLTTAAQPVHPFCLNLLNRQSVQHVLLFNISLRCTSCDAQHMSSRCVQCHTGCCRSTLTT